MKKTKLFTSLVALALVLGLGACDLTEEETPDESDKTTETGETSESTEPSESSESSETGDTGESTPGGDTGVSTLYNYTLSIGITYNGNLVTVPDYATAYIEGGWDNWAEWVSLTESGNGRYEYTFASIAPGTYEYQLVLAPNGQEPGWTYRITPDGGNASFTVKESDGDYYTNEVTVTASKALTDIIPDPDASYSDVKVTIDITYGGTSQGVLDYGTLWIEGGWDSWAGFVPCEIEGDKYVYTFESLAPIEYEFLGVIYYTDESLPTEAEGLWDYKVNGNNCTFTVDGTEVTATLVATKALSEILPEKKEEDLPTTYKLACLDSSEYCYRYFNGSTTGSTFLATTTDWDQAVDIYITPVDDNTENTCTLSFIDTNGSTKYIYHSGNSETNVSIKDEPSTWVWTGTTKGFVDQGSNRFLCLYSDSMRAYVQTNNNAPALPYETKPADPEKPVLTETFEQVSSLTNGGVYYLGSYSDDTVHFITGKTSNYQLATTTDFSDAAAVTATGSDDQGWKLTLESGSYIYMMLYNTTLEFGVSSNSTVPSNGVNTFSWSSASATLYTTAVVKSSYPYSYFEYYNNLVQAYGAKSTDSFSNAAHFYQVVEG